MNAFKEWIETVFETILFNARLVVILAVVGSMVSSVLMFVRGVLMIWHAAREFVHEVSLGHGEGEELAITLIASVDSFLFATVLLIFAMGIYELFVSKIDPASRHDDSRPNWLQVHSLDDLKGALGKVILMILIVRLFETAVKMHYERPLDLLYLGCGVLFVAIALYLQHLSHESPKHEKVHGFGPPPGTALHPSMHASLHPPAHGPSLSPPAHGPHGAHGGTPPHSG